MVDMHQWLSQVPDCPIFRPTLDQFKDPMSYMQSIFYQARSYGMCKIIPPITSTTPASAVLASPFTFTTKVQPLKMANSKSKAPPTFIDNLRPFSLVTYEKMATKFALSKLKTSAAMPASAVERLFWESMASSKTTTVEYGSDIEGTAFSKNHNDPLGSSPWNLTVLPLLSKSTLRLMDRNVPGVTYPMLYIGMLFSMFAWHVEDHYLYSINYHHMGAPKTWYGVPAVSAMDFERVAARQFENLDSESDAHKLLIGKCTMFSPSHLLDVNIPVYRTVQQPGEFVVTFPRSYHSGFSHGFNCGEAVNFAMADWYQYAAMAARRYSLLLHQPILVHENLLCREVLSKFSSELHGPPKPQSSHKKSALGEKYDSESMVKAALVRLMRSVHRMRWLLLVQRGARPAVLPQYGTCTQCSLCKAQCYLAVVDCNCLEAPICLNHRAENQQCSCGPLRTVLSHPDIDSLASLAAKFEADPRVASMIESESQLEENDSLNYVSCEESVPSTEFTDYVPWAPVPLPPSDDAQEDDVGSDDFEEEGAEEAMDIGVLLFTVRAKRSMTMKRKRIFQVSYSEPSDRKAFKRSRSPLSMSSDSSHGLNSVGTRVVLAVAAVPRALPAAAAAARANYSLTNYSRNRLPEGSNVGWNSSQPFSSRKLHGHFLKAEPASDI